MTRILSIETATSICSIAIHQDGELLANADLFLEKSHSNSLALLIEQVLDHCEISMNQLDAIAVSSGPGSYTGLRIGLSTAKGLCYALDIPLIAISSLDTMLVEVLNIYKKERTLYIPMLDARRMEVFLKIADKDFNQILPQSNLILEADSFNEYLNDWNEIVLFGNGANKAVSVLENFSSNFHFVKHINPSAKFMGGIAHEKYNSKQFENLAYFEPNYGKEFYSPQSKKKSFLDPNR